MEKWKPKWRPWCSKILQMPMCKICGKERQNEMPRRKTYETCKVQKAHEQSVKSVGTWEISWKRSNLHTSSLEFTFGKKHDTNFAQLRSWIFLVEALAFGACGQRGKLRATRAALASCATSSWLPPDVTWSTLGECFCVFFWFIFILNFTS